ncbi:phosphatase PAP2 family protein [Aurantiacibacter spongiae]|uniref:Phosphatase PAP2 family protein n=1 Tax=Aurantiacibacter spongiae TaxID=2488860 RepID=A0A3N5DFU4_9SPHN|nr:phosphatase PAP2 family protein [Aurantiacibacter spongiae]RPF70522.1 phosphatase PAP2 family protein [Aurantiacibacter spongiae]
MNQAPAVSRILRPHRTDSRILVAFLLFAAALLGLIMLASEVAEGDTFALDKAIVVGLRQASDPAVPIGPHWLEPAMVSFTALGGAPVLTLVTIFAAGFLLAQRKFAHSVFVAATIAGGAFLSTVIKSLFDRARPEIVPHLVDVSSASFPSGHSMNSAIVYLTLAVLVARGQEQRRLQVYLIGAAVMLVLLIGCTRVYLGVHWPSDVLAGWFVGACFAAAASLLAKRLQARHKIERPGETSSERAREP